MDYKNCNMCARRCGVDRESGELGFCGMDSTPRVARYSLHMWEEPIISGDRGSGTIFFSGCSLKCVFCQNREISRGRVGRAVTSDEIADMMKELFDMGAHNINFVTPTHYARSVADAVRMARARGVILPTVYNTSSYECRETITDLSDTVDIYLADFKYYRPETAAMLAAAINYPNTAQAAIAEMVKQKPRVVIEDGIMKSGVILRILLLPSHVAEAKLTLNYLYKNYGDSVYYSLMSQYTPIAGVPEKINRRVTKAEYYELVSYAEKLGIKNAFIQGTDSAGECFIPDFDLK